MARNKLKVVDAPNPRISEEQMSVLRYLLGRAQQAEMLYQQTVGQLQEFVREAIAARGLNPDEQQLDVSTGEIQKKAPTE